MPGIGNLTVPWDGSRFITGFSISFFGLPAGTEIIASGPSAEDTTFEVQPFDASDVWDRTINGHSVSFSAPDPLLNRINPAQDFFVNVSFDGPFDPAGLSFIAEYSMVVPEPSSLTLTIPAICTLVSRRRRKYPRC